MNWRQRLRVVTRKDGTAQDLDDELRFHLDHLIEEKIASGLSPREARYAAFREFGAVEVVKDECRSARGLDWLENLVQDVRYAWRNFRRRPGFALAVCAITAAGIGCSTAVFTFVDRVLFRPLPYADATRIVSVGTSLPWLEYDFLTAHGYADLRRNPAPLAAVTSWNGVADCDLVDARPQRLACARVEASYLPVMGIEPAAGRNFMPEEDVPGAPRVALISHALWRTRFGAQQDAIGRTIPLDGQQVRIVGVLPAHFELPTLERADLLIPQALPPSPPPGVRPLRVYARLRPGASPESTRDALQSIAARIFSDFPPSAIPSLRLHLRGLREAQAGDFRAASWTLFGAVLSMLLIACANAANLFLARAVARGREIAIRVALGAGRACMIRQTLAETLLLSLTGGLAGVALAYGLMRFFLFIAPKGIPHLATASLDFRVLAFSFAMSLLCGAVCGIVPAWYTPRPEMLTGARATRGGGAGLRRLLVGAQLAVSLILLTSAGLLLQSLWNRQSLALGLRTDHAVAARLVLGPRYARPPAREAFYNQLEERLARLPGIEAVALADSLPPGGTPRSQPSFALQAEGRPREPQTPGAIVIWRAVTPSYFRTLGIPLVRGRNFTEEDRRPESLSMIVNETFARRLFGGADPVGRRVSRFPGSPRTPQVWYTVIGVVADAGNAGLSGRIEPEYYLVRRHGASAYEDAPSNTAVIMRGSATLTAMQSWLSSEIAALDPVLPPDISSLDRHVSSLAARPRFQASLLALFAAAGLLLAAFGVYGLVAYLVAQREREFGIRMALGATPSQIMRLVLRDAFRWTAGGVAAGLAGAVAAAYLLRSLVFRVSPADPRACFAASLILLALALMAALTPARRVARLDPALTLRQE